MLRFLTLLTVSLSPPDRPADAYVISPAVFRSSFDAARIGRLSIPAQVHRAARRYRYVFVAGFYNERMPGYFAQNAKELRARGVSRRAIHFVYPSSHETVAGNAEAIRSRFEEIAREGPEKLVVIAHSRGACDALAFALQNPDFVSDHIQALFLVQGPFGGTGVADYVTGEGPPMDSRMPLRHRVVAHILGRLEVYLLDRGKHGGLYSMTRRASEEFWERTLEEHPEAIPIVSPKVFYVTTQTKLSRHRPFQQAVAWYLGTYFGPNDGLVTLGDQSVPGLGTVLAVLDAGHSDLTNRFPSARPKARLRKALIDAIIMAIGEPRTARRPDADSD